MSICFVEILILIVGYMNHAVLDRKSIIVVYSGIMAPDLDSPAFQVLTVEELNPFCLMIISKKA